MASYSESLISFSCPAALALADVLTNRVKQRFEPRLATRPAYCPLSIEIERSVRAFDRVAL